MVLTADGALQARIAHPRHKLAKTYWVQVEGVAEAAALAALRRGVALPDFTTAPAGAEAIAEPPGLWPRHPPIRVRKAIPTAWLRDHADRGQEPAGAADDRGGRPADAAAHPLRRRSVDARRASRRAPGAREPRRRRML